MQVNRTAMPNKDYPTRLKKKKTLKIPLKFQPTVNKFFKSETWKTIRLNLGKAVLEENVLLTIQLSLLLIQGYTWLG